jgi:hypothetical protein
MRPTNYRKPRQANSPPDTTSGGFQVDPTIPAPTSPTNVHCNDPKPAAALPFGTTKGGLGRLERTIAIVATGASAGAARDDYAWRKAGAKNREECCGDYDALSSRSENPVAAPFAPMPVAVVVS